MSDIIDRLNECIRKQAQFYPSDPELPTLREAVETIVALRSERDDLRAQIMRLRPKVREPYKSHPGYHGHGESIIDGPYFGSGEVTA